MSETVVLLGPLLFQQGLRRPIAALLLPVGAHRGTAVVPHHTGWPAPRCCGQPTVCRATQGAMLRVDHAPAIVTASAGRFIRGPVVGDAPLKGGVYGAGEALSTVAARPWSIATAAYYRDVRPWTV